MGSTLGSGWESNLFAVLVVYGSVLAAVVTLSFRGSVATLSRIVGTAVAALLTLVSLALVLRGPKA